MNMVALAVVALVAAALGAFTAYHITRRMTMSMITREIGGRHTLSLNPVDEHHRLMKRVRQEISKEHDYNQTLTAAINSLKAGVIVVDRNREVMFQNRWAKEVSSRSHERTLIEATAKELLDKAFKGDQQDTELELYGPPNRIFYIHAMPMRQGENIAGGIVLIDDVTNSHRIEKTRRDFVANLSHELRTPVGALSLLAEMVRDEPDDDVRSHLAGRVIIETERLANTIDDLLELSKIESRTVSLDEHVVLNDLVSESIERVRVAATAADIQVRENIENREILITGSSEQLRSALVNLIENAVKYSDAGDVVTVSVATTEENILIKVADTGHGIPARELDRIFERFYRVDGSRDSNTGGTGIGLSIVRHVALNHGGNVSVDSFEGEGSTFTITLPLERLAVAEVDEPLEQGVPQSATPTTIDLRKQEEENSLTT